MKSYQIKIKRQTCTIAILILSSANKKFIEDTASDVTATLRGTSYEMREATDQDLRNWILYYQSV